MDHQWYAKELVLEKQQHEVQLDAALTVVLLNYGTSCVCMLPAEEWCFLLGWPSLSWETLRFLQRCLPSQSMWEALDTAQGVIEQLPLAQQQKVPEGFGKPVDQVQGGNSLHRFLAAFGDKSRFNQR